MTTIKRVEKTVISNSESNENDVSDEVITKCDDTQLKYVKATIVYVSLIHVAAIIGLYLAFTSAMWKTLIFAFVYERFTLLGVIGGAHRLWSHRSYKAKLPLRIFYMLGHTSSYETSVFHWVRYHRVHHKYSDTDGDPHNSSRGLLFSHIGWFMRELHPQAYKQCRAVDMRDVLADPVVQFNKKYYNQLVFLTVFLLPTVIPIYFWNESLANAFFVGAMLRLTVSLNEMLSVNSFAHFYGYRPYNSKIRPAENMALQLLAGGEGFHNYHHAFPYDYAASEFGMKWNMTTAFIELVTWLGLAYDLKTVSKSAIEARKLRNTLESSSNE